MAITVNRKVRIAARKARRKQEPAYYDKSSGGLCITGQDCAHKLWAPKVSKNLIPNDRKRRIRVGSNFAAASERQLERSGQSGDLARGIFLPIVSSPRSRSVAENTKARLETKAKSLLKDQRVFIVPTVINDQNHYRVIVGSGMSDDRAGELCNSLKGMGFRGCFVSGTSGLNSSHQMATGSVRSNPIEAASSLPAGDFVAIATSVQRKAVAISSKTELELSPTISQFGLRVRIQSKVVKNAKYYRVIVGNGMLETDAREVCGQLRSAKFKSCFIARR